ncbi:E3 ubiquitin-protein ligase rnf213-alpha-like [Mercenaria mercenaria]|uniref:E3 ubiquitin-protein ligase rnf213-alpha-like n=1 Tax=Mercenaria mercenaria TaxID=6596 RepID=UPI00234F1754|nr:E3 ubiquitin-protein ligase rnf213-alpha-like [Mercenaria mercenaria]
MNEIKCCQEVFFYNCHLERDIARTNKTLMENVFIMVVCIELRIPLFLVGRPGSSKSLAKTILFDAMLGNASRRYPYRELKQAQMVTFQCSPITAKSGIENAFSQCAQLQRDKDLDTFVSVVVLDDMDMADNSTGMPLQTLPQLLDDGVLGLESPATHKKVAFIGISGHVPEPALVNRGVIVQTEVPDLQQLKDIASSMCISDSDLITPLIEPMAKSYLEIVETTSKTTGEFFGLRDFYRFLKTVFNFTDKSRRKATWHELLYSIKRNFGGLDSVVAPAEILRKNLTTVVRFELEPRPSDPDCTLLGLVQTQLQSDGRYLLLMTENYGSLNIIQQTLFKRLDIKYITMFGSSFPGDQKDTKVCLYLEEIKYFMQNGSTVVLLNLERLYGSLQDALNQYYIYFGGERYVDLGLPTHRIKCPVHKNFRLIVVEEKNTVYKKFPKTLLSRFEKHVFTHTNILPLEQIRVAHELEDWVKTLMTQRKDIGRRAKVEDVFIGYNGDTCASVVLDIWDKHKHLEYTMEKDSKVLREAKSVLLWCATPELLERIDSSSLSNPEKKFLKGLYLTEQAHDSLIQYLNVAIVLRQRRQLFTQITTHSKLISAVQKTDISKATEICAENISILRTLTSFETEEQFVKTIRQHIQRADKDPSLLFVQCDAGDENDNLIAFARYCVTDQLEKMKDELRAPVHVVLIIQLQRGTSYTGFQCGLWHSVHIDDLKTEQI